MSLFYSIHSIGDETEGIKEIINSANTLKALVIPRRYLDEFFKLPEANQPGIYILYSFFDGGKTIYIGQSGFSVADRLYRHNLNKKFWDTALVFVERGNLAGMTSSHTKAIESILCEKAINANVCKLDNIASSNAPQIQLSEKYIVNIWANEAINITKMLMLPFFIKGSRKYKEKLSNITNDNNGNKVANSQVSKSKDIPVSKPVDKPSKSVDKSIKSVDKVAVVNRTDKATKAVSANKTVKTNNKSNKTVSQKKQSVQSSKPQIKRETTKEKIERLNSLKKPSEIVVNGIKRPVINWSSALREFLDICLVLRGKELEELNYFQNNKKMSKDKEIYRKPDGGYTNYAQLSNGVYVNVNLSRENKIKEMEEVSKELGNIYYDVR